MNRDTRPDRDSATSEETISSALPLNRRRFLQASGAAGLTALGQGTAAAKGTKRSSEEILIADRKGMAYWESLTFTCLQGLANRDGARVFLTGGRKGGVPWYDEYDFLPPEGNVFLDWYEGYDHLSFRELGDIYDLFEELDTPFSGYVIVDTTAPETANIAANYASIEDLLPVTEAMLQRDILPDAEVVYDLRGTFAPGDADPIRFGDASRVETYEWAYQNQWPKANHARIAGLSTPEPAEFAAIDIASFTEDAGTIFLKFEDSAPADGFGAQLISFAVVDGGTPVVEIDPCTPEEQQYLVDTDERPNQSACNARGNRYVNKDHTWYYEISGVEGADEIEMQIFNQYRVSVATDLDGPYTELVSNTTKRQSDSYGVEPGYQSLTVYNSHGIRDFVVADRGFFFNLASTGSWPDERALKGKLLAEMPPRSYVLGWVAGPSAESNGRRGSETAHVSQVSENGQLTIGGGSYAANYSFHSRVEIGGAIRRFRKTANRPHAVDGVESKIYLTFVLSDGDSLNSISRHAHDGEWLFPERGEIPFGWEMQPLLADIAPGILDYFGQTATENDHFVAAASGIGYTYPSKVPMDALADHLDATQRYLRETGMSTLTVLNRYNEVPPEKRELYAEKLHDELNGVIQGYVRGPGGEYLYGTDTKDHAGPKKHGHNHKRDHDHHGKRGHDHHPKRGDGGHAKHRKHRKHGKHGHGSNGRLPTKPSGAMAWTPTAFPATHSDSVDELLDELTDLATNRSRRPLFVPLHFPRSNYPYPKLVELVDRLDGDTFEVVGPDEFYTLFDEARPGSTIVEPPEGFTPSEVVLTTGEDNDVTVPIQGFGSDPTEVDLTYTLTADFLADPVTGEVTATVGGGDEATAVSYTLSIPDVQADPGSGGRLEYTIDDGSTSSTVVPVVFDIPPKERPECYEVVLQASVDMPEEASYGTNRATRTVDLSSVLEDDSDTVYLRFDDNDPADGGGSDLYGVELSADGTEIAGFTPGTSDEDPYLLYGDGSGTGTNSIGSHRYADEESFWIYEFSVPEETTSLSVDLDIRNEFLVSVSPTAIC